MHHFFRVVLRTTDVANARAFYAAVLGDDARLPILPLHEQAVARGAPPHWLAMIEVADVDCTLGALVARGASALGPKWVDATGMEGVSLRDPGGAVLGLARRPEGAATERPPVSWYALNTASLERAVETYAALFGWRFGEPLPIGDGLEARPFAFAADGAPVGSFSDIAGRPGVHPHWLVHFSVAALEPALAAVRERGGHALPLLTAPDGSRVAVCEDAQGAAFALRSS